MLVIEGDKRKGVFSGTNSDWKKNRGESQNIGDDDDDDHSDSDISYFSEYDEDSDREYDDLIPAAQPCSKHWLCESEMEFKKQEDRVNAMILSPELSTKEKRRIADENMSKIVTGYFLESESETESTESDTDDENEQNRELQDVDDENENNREHRNRINGNGPNRELHYIDDENENIRERRDMFDENEPNRELQDIGDENWNSWERRDMFDENEPNQEIVDEGGYSWTDSMFSPEPKQNENRM